MGSGLSLTNGQTTFNLIGAQQPRISRIVRLPVTMLLCNLLQAVALKETFVFTQPDKLVAPDGINGPSSVKKQSAGNVFSIKNPNSSFQYVWTLPTGAKITAGQNTSSITVTWGTSGGNIKAQSKTAAAHLLEPANMCLQRIPLLVLLQSAAVWKKHRNL